MKKFAFHRAAAKKVFVASAIILCLYPSAYFLSSQNYPLLMYVTACDSDNTSIVYKKINQVFATVIRAEVGPLFQLSHSVPNFESYSIRINQQGAWRRWHAHSICVTPAPDATSTLEIKAHNRLGGETSVFTFATSSRNGAAPTPGDAFSNSYKFEDWRAPGIKLFQRYTRPVVDGRTLTWDRAMAVFDWTTGLLRVGDEKKLYVQPVAILQERLQNPQSRFLCGSFASFFVAACHSIGVNARLVHLERSNGDGHYIAEAWSDEHQKWIAMDPMYKRVFCDDSTCYSALDMHNAYLSTLNGNSPAYMHNLQDPVYLSLFHSLHYIMSNAVFTSPPTAFSNLVFGNPPVLHWIDSQSPAFNKKYGLLKLLLFYYAPRFLDITVIPSALFALVYIVLAAKQKFR